MSNTPPGDARSSLKSHQPTHSMLATPASTLTASSPPPSHRDTSDEDDENPYLDPDRSSSSIENSSHTSAEDRGRDKDRNKGGKGYKARRKSEDNSIKAKRKPLIPREGDTATAEGIVALLQSCANGTLVPRNKESERYTVSLSREEYNRLSGIPSWSRLSESLRWDYSATSETFSLRMPSLTSLHEWLVANTTDLVFDAAKAARTGHASSCEVLIKRGSQSITVPGAESTADSTRDVPVPDSNTSPDNTFGPRSKYYPTFVLEVGFSCHRTSQDAKILINQTKGGVRTVLLLNVDYRTSEARAKNPGIEHYKLHIILVKVLVEEHGWRASAVQRATLTSGGDHDGSLPLTLGDFYLDGLPATPVQVTHAQIWAIFEDAVNAQILEDNRKRRPPKLEGNLVGKRQLSDSEEEEKEDATAEGRSSNGWNTRLRKKGRTS